MSQRRRQEGKTTAAPSHHTPQRRHATPPSMPRIVIAPTAVVRTMAFLTASSRARLMHADPHAGETCAMYVVLRFATRLRDDVQRDADPILGAWLPEDVEGGACEFDDLAGSLLDCGVVPQQLMVDDAEPLKRLLLDAVAGAPVVRVPCRRTMGFARWFWKRLLRVTFQPCCTSVNIAVAGVGSTQLTFFHACVSDPDGSSSQLASRRHWIQPRTWTFEADKSPHLAAAEGHTPCLMVLQRLGVDLHAHAADNPYSLATPARFAAAAGKPQSLRFLISDAREKEDTPQLLTVCAEGDHVDCIEVLVAEGADLRVSGQQLFAKAVECNSCAVVKKCLVGWNCADPFLMDPCGTDSICTAALYGHATVLEALRDANVDLLAGKYNSSHDVLTAAVRGGDAKSVALVASVKGASRRLNFAAALNLAAEIDAPNLFSTLVGLLNDDAGADARAECLRHVTLRPVFGLPQFSLTLLRTLLEGGVDPNAALDQHGSTALHRLAKSDTPAVSAGMKLLLQHGAHVDARDAFGCTPLHYVAREDHETIIGLLHTAGCDVNARDVEGQTPLHYAAKQCHFRCVSRLARCGADVRALDNQNRSLLWFAAQSGDIATVKLAVSAGLNVHARNGTGMSVVCAAVSSANGYRALRALSDAGASFTQPFPDGSLPLDVFKSNAQYDPEMAAVLRSLPASLWRAGVVKKTSR